MKYNNIFRELENRNLLETVLFCHYELDYSYDEIEKSFNTYVNQLIKDLKKEETIE